MWRIKYIVEFVFILPLFAKGQDVKEQKSNNERGGGIHFENKLSWQQIKDKAKNEKKYIFIDCFATWCEPCKFMDENVYSKETVAAYVDSDFIAIKVQMDTSKQDNEITQNWYAAAHDIQQEYKVTSFPTYLFFSPEGKIVHRGLGSKSADDFIKLVSNAHNPDRQYYPLLEKYRSGSMIIEFLPYLARTAENIKEKDLGNSIARVYFEGYLFTLSERELCTRGNIAFITEFGQILRSKDKCFDLFYRRGYKVDSVMGVKGLAQSVADRIITREEIASALERAYANKSSPKWGKIYRNIKDKFGMDYADRNILSAKVKFFEHERNWKKHISNFVKHIDKYGVGNSLADYFLNNDAWYVFQHSSRRSELNRALAWSERAIQINDKPMAGYIDTKANLLYKLGKKKVAISIEEIAVKIEPDNSELRENLEKMKQNIPTWSSE